MSPDPVETLGLATLAHRLKRLMNRLLAEAEAAYGALGIPIKPRWCSTLSLLETEGPLAVTDVAARLGMSHPAVVQILDDMASSGLVTRTRDGRDGRRRLLDLSPKGRAAMPALRRVFAAQARVADDLVDGRGQELLALLDRAHAGLDRTDFAARLTARLDDDDLADLPGRLTSETPR